MGINLSAEGGYVRMDAPLHLVWQYPRQNFTMQRMSLSNGPFDKAQPSSGACAKADELVFKVNDAALWVEQSPLRLRPSKLARVLVWGWVGGFQG
jgi:hypothetical protein